VTKLTKWNYGQSDVRESVSGKWKLLVLNINDAKDE
jgi:hypothetical protein